MIAARHAGLRQWAAAGIGRAGCGATKREVLPNVEAAFSSGGWAVAAQRTLVQAIISPKVDPERASPPVGPMKLCRMTQNFAENLFDNRAVLLGQPQFGLAYAPSVSGREIFMVLFSDAQRDWQNAATPTGRPTDRTN